MWGVRFWGIAMLGFVCVACQTSTNSSIDLKQAAEINTTLGLMYIKQNNFQVAEEKLFLAEQQDKSSQHVTLALAYFFQKTHQRKLANDYYQKALNRAPDDCEVWNNYGAFLCEEGQYVQGLYWLTQAAQGNIYAEREKARGNLLVCQKIAASVRKELLLR
ncbi:MAG: type pilus biosis/stability protein PilW [Gammaproteobacteria bacterium]|jgi:type IV pilus assembly protein PilF|nr:type pilus biosis/stability protein PilW [Gammaproteobacteria bacterium]